MGGSPQLPIFLCLPWLGEEESADTKVQVSTEPVSKKESFRDSENKAEAELITDTALITKAEADAEVGVNSKAATDIDGNYIDSSDAEADNEIKAHTEGDADVEASAEIVDTEKTTKPSGPRVGAGNIEYSNEVLDEKEKCILILKWTEYFSLRVGRRGNLAPKNWNNLLKLDNLKSFYCYLYIHRPSTLEIKSHQTISIYIPDRNWLMEMETM